MSDAAFGSMNSRRGGVAAAKILDDEHGDIVTLMRLSDKDAEVIEDKFDDAFTARCVTGAREGLFNGFHAEELAIDVHGLGDAVGVKNQRVAGVELQGAALKIPSWYQAEDDAANFFDQQYGA